MNRGYMKNTVIKTIALITIFCLMPTTYTHAMKRKSDEIEEKDTKSKTKKREVGSSSLVSFSNISEDSDYDSDDLLSPVYTTFPKDISTFTDASLYGNKTANVSQLTTLFSSFTFLEVLNTFCYQNNIQATVKVPEFMGVSNKEVADLLLSLGFNIQEEWNKIIPNKEQQELIIKDKKLTKEFTENLGAFGKKIKKLKANSNNNNTLPLDAIIFIKTALNNNWRLMVRSTGKEDSKDVANAGGNKSKLNVPANKTDIFKAIISVVASYVSLKSISQRLEAGDKTIFNTPFTPILIQRMIGEPLNGTEDVNKIPACGVIYTLEPNGEYKDLIVIQASYGLNEGVVNSIVPTDTYYTESNGTIFPVTSKKTFRLIPTQKEDKSYGFAKQENPKEMSNAPALDKKQIALVDFVSRKIHDHYFEPTDIEFVFDRAQNTLYIVQARPIQKALQQKNASYFSKPASFDSNNVVSGYTANVASGSVLFVNKDQAIIAKTLEDALKIYIPMTDKSGIKAVVVKNNVEPTSHAAAVFRGAGIAIMKTNDIEKVSNWLKDSAIAIDLQQGLIVKNSTINPIAPNLIAYGWITYPIAEKISVDSQNSSNCSAFFGENKLGEKYATKELITLLKSTENYNEFIAVINELKIRTLNTAQKLYKTSKTFSDCPNLLCLNHEMELAYAPILDVINTKPMSLERLWPIKKIETLLFQKHDQTIINNLSIQSIILEYQKKQDFIKNILTPLVKENKCAKELLKNEPFVVLAINGYDLASTDEFGKQWISFVADVFKNNKQKELQELIDSLEQLDVLPSWINVCFAEAIKDNTNNCLQTLLSEFESSKNDISSCAKLLQAIKSFNISAWEKPKNFASLLETTKNDVLANITKKELLAHLDKDSTSSQLTRLVTIQVLKASVDFFDVSIKAIKGSTLYPDPETDKESLKVSRVSELVRHFYTMFETFFNHLVDQKLITKAGPLNGSFSSSLPPDTYISWLNSHTKNFSSKKDVSTLNPSTNFNVSAATFSARTVFDERHNPGSLEDVFTLIHQNHFSCIMLWLKNAININIINKPALVKNLEKREIVGNNSLETYFSGIEISHDGITSTYNVPLRNHSVEYKITFKKNNIEFTQYFLGVQTEEHRHRWDRISEASKILSVLNKTYIIEEKINDQGFEQKRVIFTESNIHDFFEELKNHINHTTIFPSQYAIADYFSSVEYTKKIQINTLIDHIASVNGLNNWAIKCFVTMPILIQKKHIDFLINGIVNNITDKDAVGRFKFMAEKYMTLIKDTHIESLVDAVAKNITNKYAIDFFKAIFEKYTTLIKESQINTLMTAIAKNITDGDVRDFFKDITEKYSNLINDSHIKILMTAITKGITDYSAVCCFKAIAEKYTTLIKEPQINTLIDAIANNITNKYAVYCFNIAEKYTTLIKEPQINTIMTAITNNITDYNALACFEQIVKSNLLKKASKEIQEKIQRNETLKNILLKYKPQN